MSDTAPATIDEILEDFEFLDDWDDRFQYLIELGDDLPEMPPQLLVDANKVDGCMSQVWMTVDVEPSDPPKLKINAASDSAIVRGLIGVLMALYSARSPGEILVCDPEQTFDKLGLKQHLSGQRRNGLYAMVKRVRALAAEHA